jgi:hypothetical protein
MRLQGQAAIDALLEYLEGVDHVHTKHGVVYYSAIREYLEHLRETRT